MDKAKLDELSGDELVRYLFDLMRTALSLFFVERKYRRSAAYVGTLERLGLGTVQALKLIQAEKDTDSLSREAQRALERIQKEFSV